MPYHCTQPTCPISLSKAEFPQPGTCVLCQNPLKELPTEPSLSEKEQELLAGLPYVIAYPLKKAFEEKSYRIKINLLKDTFLNYLKYLGLLAASEFFNSPIRDRKMVALFNRTLAETSFGLWNEFIREALRFLNEKNHTYFCPELNSYYDAVQLDKKRKQFKAEIEVDGLNGEITFIKQKASAIDMLINFRNRYLGHGQTMDEDKSRKIWEEYFPIFQGLLEKMDFPAFYPMYKREHGETYLMQSAELRQVELSAPAHNWIWMQRQDGRSLNVLPFYIVPGELGIAKEDKEQILLYESFTGKRIKFFSPEGSEKQTSGRILEKLNLLLREKQAETPYAPESFTKEVFVQKIEEENKLVLDVLTEEKKIIPGIYVHRDDIEIKLREWLGARASVFFLAAEAGSGKTNLLVEMQRQYGEWNLSSLLIRAGRMEKTSLKAQLAWMLNLDPDLEIKNYPALAGTQAEPVLLLIDGLNEAFQPEQIWQEILELSQTFEPGSIKFVLTCRAITSADLERFVVKLQESNLIYGENKEGKEGLAAQAFWLRALNMEEMKTAWQDYGVKEKNRFRPSFAFDDLAHYDRAVYNQLSNPLVMRIFLELYHGKALPKKGKSLHLWKDWLQTFSKEEQLFMDKLAGAVWEEGSNELLLDDLLSMPDLRPILESDNIRGPYQHLKNLGWISRYTRDMNTSLAFTVEGALFYLLGQKWQQKKPGLEEIKTILQGRNKLHIAGVESLLCEEADSGQINLLTELIDEGEEYLDACVPGLVTYFKKYGSEAILNALLANPTENDWKALLKLNKVLVEQQLQILRKDFLKFVIGQIPFDSKSSTELGLKAISVLDDDIARLYYSKINKDAKFLNDDVVLLDILGKCEERFGHFDLALDFYQQCLDIQLKTLGKEHPDVAVSYSNIGRAWRNKGDYDKALDFNQKCLDIEVITLGKEHPHVATSYNNIGLAWNDKGEFDKALDFYQQSLDIDLITLGNEHPDIAKYYKNIGGSWRNKGDYDKALDFYQKCLDIQLKTLGKEHPDVANSYNSIGLAWDNKGDYNEALDYFQKCLDIQLRTLGKEHPHVATCYNNIGCSWRNKGDYDKALDFYQQSLDIDLITLGNEHPDIATSYNNIGLAWGNKGDYDKALDYFQKCLDIQVKTLGNEHPAVATSYINIGSSWIMKGDYDKALDFYQQSLDIDLITLGNEHPDIATSYNNIGLIWRKLGNPEKAQEYYRLAAEIENPGEPASE